MPTAARVLIRSGHSQRFVSIASIWEMAIKAGLDKLELAALFEEFVLTHVPASKVQLLPIAIAHLVKLKELPHHHRDPFDRLLIAQALAENIPLISVEKIFDAYGVQRLWD